LALRHLVFRLALVKAIEQPNVLDEVLVSQIAAGRHEALERLHERYGSVLRSIASRQ